MSQTILLAEDVPADLAEFFEPVDTENKQDVFRFASAGYPGAHFATFPPKLIEPMILAGTSEKGACVRCGVPWRRVVERTTSLVRQGRGYTADCGARNDGDRPGSYLGGTSNLLGWEPGCTCFGKFVERKVWVEGKTVKDAKKDHGGNAFRNTARYVNNASLDNTGGLVAESLSNALDSKGHYETVMDYVSDLPLDQHPVRPCVVLDPFIGSATTATVSLEHGRYCWGIDLSEEYLRKNAIVRVQGALMEVPALRHLAGVDEKRERVVVGKAATIRTKDN